MPRVDCTGKNVDELLAGPYKEAVAAIKADPSVEAAIAKYKDENEEYGFLIDDLFILRYAISHTDEVPVAIKAVVSTLEWRHEHQALLRPFHITTDPESGKEVRRDPEELNRDSTACRRWCQHIPGFKEFTLSDATSFHGATMYGGPVFYLRSGLANPKACESTTTRDNIKNIFVVTKEAVLVVNDHIMRTRRVLVVSAAIIDAKGMGMSSVPSSEFRKIQNESSGEIEMYYPHIMGKMILVNIPAVLRVVIEGIIMLMPKSITEKTSIVAAPQPEKIAAALAKVKDLPPGTKYEWDYADTFYGVPYDSLPSFLGGSCRCGKPRVDYETGEPLFDGTALDKHGLPVGWCVDGVPNNLKEQLPNYKKLKEKAAEKKAKK